MGVLMNDMEGRPSRMGSILEMWMDLVHFTLYHGCGATAARLVRCVDDVGARRTELLDEHLCSVTSEDRYRLDEGANGRQTEEACDTTFIDCHCALSECPSNRFSSGHLALPRCTMCCDMFRFYLFV